MVLSVTVAPSVVPSVVPSATCTRKCSFDAAFKLKVIACAESTSNRGAAVKFFCRREKHT